MSRLFMTAAFGLAVGAVSVAHAQTAATQGGTSVNPAPPPPDKSGYSLFDPTPDAQMRGFSTDRPDKSNSPYTVDAGHFQYETDLVGVISDGYANGGTEYRQIFAADPTLKLGLTNSIDAEVAIGGYQSLRVKQRGDGPSVSYSGYGDTYVRVKVNVFGNDSGTTALAVIPYVKIPTAAYGIGNNQVEGGVIVPLQFSLPYNFTAIAMTEADIYKNPDDSGKHAGFENLINLSHPITDKLSIAAEFFAQVQGADVPTVYTADVAFSYLLTPNMQVDTAVYAGLNKAAPDVVGYIGLSQRF